MIRSLVHCVICLGIGVCLPARAEAQEKTKQQGITVFASPDSSLVLDLTGRLFIDAALYNQGENELGNGTELRSARLGFLGIFGKDWRGELDMQLADDDLELRDAWLSYGVGPWSVKTGNFKEPFGLEEATTSRFVTFMERGLPDAFVPGRHLGVAVRTYGHGLWFSSGVFGEDVNSSEEGDEGFGLTGRLAFAPVRTVGRTVHLGVAASRRTPVANADKPDRVKFRSRPESHVDRTRFLDTGNIEDIDHTLLQGVEAAVVYGSFAVQGEYMRIGVNRKNGEPDLTFTGGYVFASWLLTGESRPYLSEFAEFGRIIPRQAFGALELALRYSTVNLNDAAGDIIGGKGKNVTVGLNWYINPYVRIMANFIIVDNDEDADADGDLVGNDDFEVIQARFQFNF